MVTRTEPSTEQAAQPAMTALQVMRDAPVIPVIVLHELAHALPLARALLTGGIRMLEITLRTPVALACIEAIARELPQAVVGAGTVRNPADAQVAAQAGARFAVSPGYTSNLGQACRDLNLPLLPGVATAGEIMAAQDDGFAQLKFFPAMQSGGAAMLKAWQGPFGDVLFCPTGGVTKENAPSLLVLDNVACVGGSWLAPQDAMAEGDWGRITALARACTTLRR